MLGCELLPPASMSHGGLAPNLGSLLPHQMAPVSGLRASSLLLCGQLQGWCPDRPQAWSLQAAELKATPHLNDTQR